LCKYIESISNFKAVLFSYIRQLHNIFQQLTQTPSFAHCTFQQRDLLAVAIPVQKTFTTDVRQMQWWRHHMTACASSVLL